MELPIPARGESRDTFIVRCMQDTTLSDLFPVWEQRLSICYHQWNTSCDLGNTTDEAIMKATLEFTLPDEQNEFTAATKGMDYYFCLRDIEERLRLTIRRDESASPAVKEYAQSLLEQLVEIMQDRGVSSDDIT